MFEELIESAKKFGNDEFVTKLEQVATTTSTNISELTGKLTHSETELNKSINKRDSLKDMIRKNTGLEELGEENFIEYLNGLKKPSENNDIAKLQAMLEDSKTTYESEIKNLRSEASNKELNLTLLETGVLDGVTNTLGKKLILDKLRESLIMKDGSLVYVDENGTTVFDENSGKPLTVDDKLMGLYEDEQFSIFFPTKKGGGKEGDNSSSSNLGFKDISKLSRSEKAKLMGSMSSEEWQDLVRLNINKGK